MLVRAETEADTGAVQSVNKSAFGSPAESNLVAALREQVQPYISLVAQDAGGIVGHIMFSPATLPDHPELRIMGLAPMAVSPEHQRTGIGSALVRAGLGECEKLGYDAVVVLGHPEYYPRFGFLPAALFGIGCHYEVPDEAFMLIELRPGCLDSASGKIEYHPAFDSL